MVNKRSKYGTLAKYKKACAAIFEEREQKCDGCGKFIFEAKYQNFHHTAGRRANFINKDEIRLICFVCHSQEHGIKELNGVWLN